ncbi:MAG: heavy metal translocating P-type ATPase [Clostridia bacterium]|nr:heavy metal translocating P-type ATPase [Clostridia bacterium]
MRCKILHESKGRIRVRLLQRRMTSEQADRLEVWLKAAEGVEQVQVFERTCDAVIRYRGERAAVLSALAGFSWQTAAALEVPHSSRAMTREFEDRLVGMCIARAARRIFLPAPLRMLTACVHSWRVLKEGLRTLVRGKLEVPVLDAAAVMVSLVRGDWETASSIVFMLGVGELLEDWTHKKTVEDLARSMALPIEQVWCRTADGAEVLCPIADIKVDDLVVVRTGGLIPLDGEVAEGEAMVNQASMTGEPLAVRKGVGALVYAGTAVEEGECVIRVRNSVGEGRYDRIVRMIEETQRLKSAAEDRAANLADKLVPYSLAGTALTWALTRDSLRATSILMADFSCALKLAIPIAVLSAMREGRERRMAVKGGRYLEAVARADTVVFDKTGTLTNAAPKVTRVVPFGGNDGTEMLRLAACLEEHFPHPVATAVVNHAKEQGLLHEERHSEVEYVVAHGISSRIEGKRVVIGSYHFVFQDEACRLPEGGQEAYDALPGECSHLYMAIGGELAAVLCIEDPLRPEAAEVVAALKELGVARVVMLTGDSEAAALAAAKKAGVDQCLYGVLPEDKAAFIQREREAGRKVLMIGDGVNDSPALSAADVGLAIGSGSAIAREVADITLTAEDLRPLVTLRRLSMGLMRRIDDNYRFILSFNAGLIALGALGILAPAPLALLHNTSTLAISLKSMTNLLEAAKERSAVVVDSL